MDSPPIPNLAVSTGPSELQYVVLKNGGMIVLRETDDQPRPNTPPTIYLPMALSHARSASCGQCEARHAVDRPSREFCRVVF